MKPVYIREWKGKLGLLSEQSEHENHWNENLSQEFIDYGCYFVPKREEQIGIIIRLLPMADQPTRIIELCCGEGLLAEAILNADPRVYLLGFDGSQEMIKQAEMRLAHFGERFKALQFDLADRGWRRREVPVQAVVTSLAVHHLDDDEKATLFQDVNKLLVPGGVFIIADMIDPVHSTSRVLAAETYDQVVLQKSMALDGNTKAYDFFQREGWNIFHYLDPQDIDKPSPLFDQLKWLEKAGFCCVDVFWLFAGHAIFGGWKPRP